MIIGGKYYESILITDKDGIFLADIDDEHVIYEDNVKVTFIDPNDPNAKENVEAII